VRRRARREDLFPAPLQRFAPSEWPQVAGECLGHYSCDHGTGYTSATENNATVRAMENSVASAVLQAVRTAQIPAGPGGGGQNLGGGVSRWAPVILAALGLLGQSPSWLGAVESRMGRESGGNPVIVNKWDSNWAAGTPSVGLMQVIGPTYAAYAGAFRGTGPFEYGVSVAPLANIFAGLNYAIHRYGSLAVMTAPGGYDSGGYLPPGISVAVNSTGRPERVLAPGQRGGGNAYYITINMAAGTDKETGRRIVEAIRKFEQGSRSSWRT